MQAPEPETAPNTGLSSAQFYAGSDAPLTPSSQSRSGRRSPNLAKASDPETDLSPLDGLQNQGSLQKSREVFTHRLTRQHKNLNTSWNGVRLLREQVQASRSRLQRYQQTFLVSRREYNDALDLMSIQYVHPPPHVNLNLLRSRVDYDRSRVEAQVSECVTLDGQLKGTEVVLQRREDQFMKAAQDLLRLTNARSTDDFVAQLASSHLVSPRSPGSPLSFQIHPYLESYYDKAAEVKLMGEQLVDLDYAYRDDAALRGLQQDQGAYLPISDEEFVAEYLRKRKLVEIELDLVISQADEMRKKCQLEGLDLDAYRRRVPESDASFAQSDSELPPPRELPDLSALDFDDAEIIRASPASDAYNDPHNELGNPSVLSWIENVETLAPGAGAQEFRRVSEQFNLDGMTVMGSPPPTSQKPALEGGKRLSEPNLKSLGQVTANRQEVIDDFYRRAAPAAMRAL